MWWDEEEQNSNRFDRAFSRRSPTTTPPEDDGGGFFGGIASAVEGVGGFLGNMVEGVVESAQEAGGGLVDLVGGAVRQSERERRNEQLDKELEEIERRRAAGQIGDEEYKNALLRINRGSQEVSKSAQEDPVMDRDPYKVGAAVFDTGLNLATLGAGTAARTAGKEAVEQAGKGFLREGLERGAARTGEGALLGGVSGAAQPIIEEGTDANVEDIWMGALSGGALGGALGGAVGLTDPVVRQGLREVPGALRQNVVDTMNAPRAVREGGYVQLPGGAAADETVSAVDEAAGVTNTPAAGEVDVEAARATLDRGRERLNRMAADGEIDDAQYQQALRGLSQEYDRLTPTARDAGQPQVASQAALQATPTGQQTSLIEELTPEQIAARNNAVDFVGPAALPTTREVPVSDIVSAQTGRIPTPAVDLNPPAPREMLSQTLDDIITGRTSNPQLALPSGLPEAPPPNQRLTRGQARQAASEGDPFATGDSFRAPGRQRRFIADEAGNVGTPKEMRPLIKEQERSTKLSNEVERATQELGEPPAIIEGAKGPRVLKASGTPVPESTYETIKEVADTPQVREAMGRVGFFKDINTIVTDMARTLGGELGERFARVMDDRVRAPIQAAGARNVRYRTEELDPVMNEAAQRYNFNQAQNEDINRWLSQQKDPDKRAELFENIRKNHGDEVAQKAQEMFNEFSPRFRSAMEKYNQTVIRLGQPDKVIGDLGEFYWPRVYKAENALEKAANVKNVIVDPEQTHLDVTGADINSMSGSSTAANPALQGQPRGFGVAPVGSEYAKPTVGWLSHQKSRTASSPVAALANPLDSAFAYLTKTNEVTNNTEAVASIRGAQKAIEELQKKGGRNDLTPLHDALNNSANSLLGKTNEADRFLSKYPFGQKIMRASQFVMRQLARSQLFGSITSTMAQTGQMPLMIAEFGPVDVSRAAQDMFRPEMKELYKESDFLVGNQFVGRQSQFHSSKLRRMIEKGEDITATPMQLSSEIAAKVAWGAGYRKALNGGLKGKKAIQEADRLAGQVMSNRVAGLRASAYESRALQPILAYTQDVNQIWQNAKGMLGDNNYAGLATLLAGTFAFNQAYQAITGNPLGADPVQAALDAGDVLTTDELTDAEGNPVGLGERLVRAGGRLTGELAEATPTGNIALGTLYPEHGMNLPGDSRTLSRTELFGDSQVGRFGASTPLQGGIERPLSLLGIPGTSQFQRSQEGLAAVQEGESITPSGRQRFTVEQTPENFIRALLFGQYATPEGQQYLEDQTRRLAGYDLQ